MTSVGKFRISLSLDQINWILENCKDSMPDLYNQLLLHKIKADGGLTKPAFITAPAPPPGLRKGATLKEKYDFVVTAQNKGQQVSADLLEAYTEYRYLNDLMTPPEMEAYENEAIGDLG